MNVAELVIKLFLDGSGVKSGAEKADAALGDVERQAQDTGKAIDQATSGGAAGLKAVERQARAADDGLQGVEGVARKLQAAFDEAVKEGKELDQVRAEAEKMRESLVAAGASKRELDALDRAAKKLGVTLKDSTEKGEGGFTRLASTAGKALAVIGGVAAIKSAADAYYEQATAIEQTSKSLGLSMERMQAWQGAAATVGGDAEGIADRFRDMSDYIIDATKFDSGPLKDIAKELDISLTTASGKARATEDVMLDLADAFQRVGAQASTAYGMQMSFDPATIALLQKGRGELEALLKVQQEQAAFSKEDAELARKQKIAVMTLNVAWQSFVNGLLRVASPIITGMTEDMGKFTAFLARNSRAIGIALTAIAAVITAAMVPALASMATAAWAVIAPFAPFIAAAAALGLVLDDLWTFMEGGNSAFEEFLRWLGLSDKQIEQVRAVLNALGGVIKSVFNLFTSLFSLDGSDILDALKDVQSSFENLKKIFGDLLGSIKEKIFGLLPDWMKGFLGVEETPTPPAVTETPALASTASAPAGGSTVNHRNVQVSTSIGAITVQTQAADAQGIARDIGTELRNQTAQADGAYGA